MGEPDSLALPTAREEPGPDPASTPVRIMTGETATINTETCAAIGMDLEQIKSAFSALGINVIETKTQQEF